MTVFWWCWDLLWTPLPLIFIVLHFWMDWFFQNDWMALNKSRRWDILAVHVAVVAAPLLFDWRMAAITFVAHYLTDALTSRMTTRLWFIDSKPLSAMKYTWGETGFDYEYIVPKEYDFAARIIPGRRHWFFVVIGFDQLLHYTQLALTWRWLHG